jgi:hypothetical protein
MARIVITETADAHIKDIIAYLTREAGRTLAAKYAPPSTQRTIDWPTFPGSVLVGQLSVRTPVFG